MTTATAHDVAACLLCKRRAEGFTTTRNGVYIPDLCSLCNTHHIARRGHAMSVKVVKNPRLCPECEMNERPLQHVRQAMNPARTERAPYCESCLIDKGSSYVDLGEVQFWDKLPRVSLEGPDPDDLFDSLNGIEVAGRVAS